MTHKISHSEHIVCVVTLVGRETLMCTFCYFVLFCNELFMFCTVWGVNKWNSGNFAGFLEVLYSFQHKKDILITLCALKSLKMCEVKIGYVMTTQTYDVNQVRGDRCDSVRSPAVAKYFIGIAFFFSFGYKFVLQPTQTYILAPCHQRYFCEKNISFVIFWQFFFY